MNGRRALAAAGVLAVFVGAATAADVALRARAACRQGERWLDFAAHPEKRRALLDARLTARLNELDKERADGRLDADEFSRASGLARFERDRDAAADAPERAYVWFESAADLFSPPQTRWSARGRAGMAQARELWRRERRARGLPVEDYRLQ